MKAKRLIVMLVCVLGVVFLAACHEHSFDSYTISVAPTESSTGTAIASCECDETTEVTLPALSDTTVWTVKGTVDATCTEKGSKTYTSIYGEVVVEISANGHDHSEYEITSNPTETQKGSATAKCSCGNSIEVEVPALNDPAWSVKSTTEATCTEDGNKVYTSIYGEVTVVLGATDHAWGEWTTVTAPTKTTAGVIVRGCSNDASHVERFEIPALNETDYGYTKVEAECGLSGKETYTYVKDGTTLTFEVTLDALTHKYGEWTVTTAPTETSDGLLTRVCSHNANHTETHTLPALNKTDYSYSKVDAVCNVAGKEVYAYTKDGETFTFEVEIEALTHVYGEWTVTTAPTAREAGLLTRVCSHDAKHTETHTLPALNKTDYTCTTSAPVCGAEGKEIYTYTKDSQTFTFEVVLDALTHEYGQWTVTTTPTVSETGLLTRVCSHNSDHTETHTLPALNKVDYSYSVVPPVCGESDGKETYTYSKDGQTFSFEVVVPKSDHLHDEYTITTEPTKTEVGLAKAKCDCGHEIEVEVPVLTDSTVWELTNSVEVNYNQSGSETYNSVYGEVVVVLTKLVAPYDGKTYTSINLEAATDGVYNNNVVTGTDIWSNHAITFDNNGKAFGQGYPFRGYFEIKMLDPETGKIQISKYGIMDSDGDGEYTEIDPEEEVVVTIAYVDFATGIIMCPAESYAEYNLWTPFEDASTGPSSSDISASSWDDALAIAYTDPEGTIHNIFVYNEVVYFGVSFVDGEGNAVAGNACYNAPLVYVNAADNSVVEGFAYNGTKLVVADGYEGTYVNGENTLVVTGAGIAYYNGIESTYVIAAEDASYTAGAYAAGNYYEVTLDLEAKTFTMVMPKVEITFVGGEVEVEAVNANINVPYLLPVVNHTETHTFKGWFYDAECTNPVEAEFIPTQAITLYASWKAKVVITLVGTQEGDVNTLYLGEGDVIGEFLPTYGIDNVNMKKFDGWYLDETYEVSLPEDAVVSAEDTGITVYAKWIDLPAYIGTYKGTEIWNASYGNSGGKTLTIDENGKMSGLKSGIIINYNPETQTIEWKTSETSETVYKFYFNARLGIIAGIYSNYDISNDFYILSRTDEDGKANAHYGIKAAKNPTDSSRGWYAHLINMTTDLGDVELFLYNNHIYDTFTATDALGNALTATTVKDSKTLIVKDGEGNIIVSVASTGSSFNSQNNTIDLDPYFGTYTNGEDSITLDGVGGITFGESTGTYAVSAEGSAYGFDVYMNDGSEYYELTLTGNTYTLVKAMVNITYVEGEYASVEDVTVNKNIALLLPELSHDTQVFNGWYYDEACTQKVEGTFIPTKDTTLYALWKVMVTLTVNSNNGSEVQNIVYSEGDIVEIENPTLKKFRFVGWYTTSTFDEGTEWQVGSAILSNLEIFAKWEAAPAYYNTYTITRITYNSSYSTRYSDSYCYKNYSTGPYLFNIDADGNGTGTNSPFNGSFKVQNYNVETGYLEIAYNSDVYKGYLDSETGIIITNYLTSHNNLTQVFFFNPLSNEELSTNTNISSSYWHGGVYRAIEYTFEENVYRVFVMNDNVYFGVSFEDAEGNAIIGKECYTQSSLYVKDSEGNLIAKFAHDGETLQVMDGNEGTYVNGLDTIVVDGVSTVTLNGTKGTYSKAEEGSEYGLDVYVAGSYYEITLNKEEGTYTINKPMVDITFDTDDKAVVEAINSNKNIEITLPVPTNDDYIFRGWFLEDSFDTMVGSEYVPTQSIVLYAKWDVKVTLTVVYGNGLEQVELEYGSGDIANPEEPVFTNGKVFNGWYTDSELTNPYTPGEITENTTIYCAWMESVAMFGTYYGTNVYGSGNKTLSMNANLEITPDGTVSGKKTGTVESYDAETKTFKINTGSKLLYVFFDVESGILAVAYGTNETGLGTDLYLFTNKEVTSATQSDNLNGGFNKLITFNYKDGTTVDYLLMGDVVYSNVTYSSTSGDVTSQKINNAADYVIKDKEGNVLLSK